MLTISRMNMRMTLVVARMIAMIMVMRIRTIMPISMLMARRMHIRMTNAVARKKNVVIMTMSINMPTPIGTPMVLPIHTRMMNAATRTIVAAMVMGID